jgi:hypothetical protein
VVASQAVLRVHKKGKGVGSSSEVWWHLSYGNQNTNSFTLMPLSFGSEVKLGVVSLRNPDDVVPLNLWKAFAAANFSDLSSRKLDIEVWKISASKERLDAFLPGNVRVVLTDPPLIFKLHRPSDGVDPAGERLPVQPVPRGDRVAPLLWSSAAPRQRRMPRFSTTGDEELGPLLAQAIADLDLAEVFDSQQWNPSDSEPEEVPFDEEPEPFPPALAALVALVPPPPAPVPRNPVAEQGSGAAGSRSRGGGSAGVPWKSVQVSGLGRLVLDEYTSTSASIGGHCEVHSGGCRLG